MIKQATIDDLEELLPLFEAYRTFYHKAPSKEQSEAFLTERISNNESVIYLALSENKIVGFVQLYPYFSSVNLKRLWLLNDLFIHPKYRGNGFSKTLIAKAQELAINTKAFGVMLETGKENHVGNNLYPAMGFQLYDEVNFYEWRTKK